MVLRQTRVIPVPGLSKALTLCGDVCDELTLRVLVQQPWESPRVLGGSCPTWEDPWCLLLARSPGAAGHQQLLFLSSLLIHKFIPHVEVSRPSCLRRSS